MRGPYRMTVRGAWIGMEFSGWFVTVLTTLALAVLLLHKSSVSSLAGLARTADDAAASRLGGDVSQPSARAARADCGRSGSQRGHWRPNRLNVSPLSALGRTHRVAPSAALIRLARQVRHQLPLRPRLPLLRPLR